jgi:hypothetical protein
MTASAATMSAYETSLEENKYSKEVVILMGVFGFTSTLLSMIGSGCVMYMARRRLDQLMQRLVFGMSLSDFFSSLILFIFPFFLPPETGYWLGRGNEASCSALGFFWMWFMASACFYNAFLSIYFLATVRYNWKEERRLTGSRQCIPTWEIMAHIMTQLLFLSFSIMAAVKKNIRPHELLPLCTIGNYPWGCEQELIEDSN